MSSFETYDIRKDRYFPGELVLSAAQVPATLAALARCVLFFRSINSSIAVATPSRTATDEAFPVRVAPFAPETPAAQLDLRFDETPTASVDARSVEQTAQALCGPAAAADWQLRPNHLAMISGAGGGGGGGSFASKTSTPTDSGMCSRSRSPQQLPPEGRSPNSSMAGPAAGGGISCVARLLIIKVAVDSNAGSTSWFGSFSARPAEVVEEWCVPVAVLQHPEATQLAQLVGRCRERHTGSSATGVDGSSVPRFLMRQHTAAAQAPSGVTFGSVFSVETDMDDAVVVSEADVREVTELSRGIASAAASTGSGASSKSSTPRPPLSQSASASAAPASQNPAATTAAAAAAACAPEALDALCAMLEPDSAARLQRVLLWMQGVVLECARDMGGHHNASIFENAPKLSVSASVTTFGAQDGKLVEPRSVALSRGGSQHSASSFANNKEGSPGSVGSGTASPKLNDSTSGAATGANAGVFKGFSSLWSS